MISIKLSTDCLYRPFWAAALLWCLLTSLNTYTESRAPASDVFLFKEAGANLALSGQFIASNLPHMPPDEKLTYAYYPPVYPFLFGIWSKSVGLGYVQSIAFDSLIRAIRTLLLLFFLLPYLKRKDYFLAAGILLLVSFLSTDGDRPDELAMVWGLGCWYLIREAPSLIRVFVSSICLGLCGATSAAAGLFFGLGTGWFLIRCRRALLFFPLAVVISIGIFFLCNLPTYLADPKAFERFSRQIPLSTFPYQLPFVEGRSLIDFFRSFSRPLLHTLEIGKPYLFCVLLLSLLGAWLWFRARPFMAKRVRYQFFPFIWVSIFFIPLSLVVWTLQPYYLWFSCLCLLCGALVFGINGKRSRRWVPLALGVAFLPLLVREAKSQAIALQRPPEESLVAIREKVLSMIEKEARIAVTHDLYFAFKGFREVGNVVYVCDWLDRFDYVYVTSNSSRRDSDSPVAIPCESKRVCFSLVQDLASRKPLSIFGKDTPYYVRGFGGALYKNVGCPPR